MLNRIDCSYNVVFMQSVPAMYWQGIGLSLLYPYQGN